MSENVTYPVFINQDELLWQLITERLPEIAQVCADYGIDESRLLEQVKKEYDYIISGETTGLYYLIGKAFKETDIKRTEVQMYGDAGGAVIPNVLGLTGICLGDRLNKILCEDPVYYPEMFYGIGGSKTDTNPSNVRLSHNAYQRLIKSMNDIVKSSDNLSWVDLGDYEEQRNHGLYISELSAEMDLNRYEEITGFIAEYIPVNDEKTMELFRNSILETDEGSIRAPIQNDAMAELIKRINPRNIDDISYAMGLFFYSKYGLPEDRRSYNDRIMAENLGRNTKNGKRENVFREDFLERYIEAGDAEQFEKTRKMSIRCQVFPRVHIEGLVQVYYRAAYYLVHYPECR